MLNLTAKSLKPFLVFIFCNLSTLSKGQAQDSLLKKDQFKAGIKLLGAGATYERRLGSSLSLYTEASVNLTTASATSFTYEYAHSPGTSSPVVSETKVGYGWVPMITTEVRKYYNISKRIEKQKAVRNNSFNMFSIGAGYMFKTDFDLEGYEPGSSMILYSTWGIQRSFSKMTAFEFNIGPGIQKFEQKNSPGFYIHGNLKFDLVIK